LNDTAPIIKQGDARELLPTLPKATLIYLDPPFLSNEDYRLPNGTLAFSDRYESPSAYFDEIGEILGLCRDRLEDHGCLVLHVDHRTHAQFRLILDDLFGARCFKSKIVWRYRRWATEQARNFARMHDTLLRYSLKPKGERFNQLYEPLSPATLKQTKGKRTQSTIDKVTGKRTMVVTDQPSKGAAMSDVWTDIPICGPTSQERKRTGSYPTQKPSKLLERLILALTNEGELVIDPFCGSGTTLEAAQKLGRRSIGIDRSPVAIEATTKRLATSEAA
jgi:site-specific DNA-methyltransferase (adenine-specific)